MTTTSPAAPVTSAAPLPPRRRAAFAGLLLSEWTKIRSVRSTVWTLILFVVLTIGLTAGITALVVSSWGRPGSGEGQVAILADPVGFILGAGIGLGQLTICVLGVLVITTEYSTGVIRASLLAVPRRIPMLMAKLVVFAAILIVLSEIVAFGSFFLGSLLLHSKVPVTLSDSGVTRAVVGAGLYLSVLGLFAVAIGALIRHTAGGIATVIGAVLVLPIITNFLPGSWGHHINSYLPEQAGSMIYQTHQQPDQLLTSWQGFGVFCVWTALLLGVAGYLLVRRDA
ncbi:MAG TPA: ABC transporter permease [Streptosporangiaceae bacterium]|jgi:ABC-2 type transport system permease protein|nr:ABC transporter permease [Streptosporangiaceae bacterium]